MKKNLITKNLFTVVLILNLFFAFSFSVVKAESNCTGIECGGGIFNWFDSWLGTNPVPEPKKTVPTTPANETVIPKNVQPDVQSAQEGIADEMSKLRDGAIDRVPAFSTDGALQKDKQEKPAGQGGQPQIPQMPQGGGGDPKGQDDGGGGEQGADKPKLDEGFEEADGQIKKMSFECDQKGENCKPKQQGVAEGTDLGNQKPSKIVTKAGQPGFKKLVQQDQIKPAEKKLVLAKRVKKRPDGMVVAAGEQIKIDPATDGIANSVLKGV